jgi:hypothetical protein
LWGPVPASGQLIYDAQGTPIAPGTTTGPVTAATRILTQAEWPIPTRWELQFGCSIDGPAPWSNLANTDGFIARFSVVATVESASYRWPIRVGGNGPGVYPYQWDIANTFAPTGATYPLVAQTVRIELESIEVNPDVNLASTHWNWSVVPLLGLTSAGWPAP